MTILIKNGRVIDPATGTDEVLDLYVEDGTIKERGHNLNKNADQMINANNLYVMPGFIDLHVHLREPGQEEKETIQTGAAAAAKGGFTTIVAMPNTNPPVDSTKVLSFIQEKAKEKAKIHVLSTAAITKGQSGLELTDMESLVNAGAIAFSEDGKSVMDAQKLKEAMLIAQKLNVPILSHCEDRSLVNKGVMNDDENAKRLNLEGISNSVEDVITARDIILAKETKAKLHLCHCSTKDSVWMVQQAKAAGIAVTAEVCPHHFILSSDDIKEDDANFKMNPPLRSKEDVKALCEGLKDNVMDVISTDHAPHTKEEKEKGFLKSPFGIVGSETVAALTYTKLVLTGYLTPMQMAEKMSYNPAKVLNIKKGTLQEGAMADIVLFDPNKTYKIDKETFLSKGKNTPFDAWEVTGEVVMTIADGKIAYTR